MLPEEPEGLLEKLRQEKILGGVALGRFYPELKNALLVCATETASRASIDRMVGVYEKSLASTAAASPIREAS